MLVVMMMMVVAMVMMMMMMTMIMLMMVMTMKMMMWKNFQDVQAYRHSPHQHCFISGLDFIYFVIIDYVAAVLCRVKVDFQLKNFLDALASLAFKLSVSE